MPLVVVEQRVIQQFAAAGVYPAFHGRVHVGTLATNRSAFLSDRLPQLPGPEAYRLAEALGDLPLAVCGRPGGRLAVNGSGHLRLPAPQ